MRRQSPSSKSFYAVEHSPPFRTGHHFRIFLRVDLRIRRRNAPGVKAERQRAERLP